jgi:mitochondrial cardiolipin hydrolase
MKTIVQKLMLLAVFSVVFGGFALVAYKLYQQQNPEIKLTKLLLNEDKKIARAFFSPDDELKFLLIDLIDTEKKSLSVAIYTITDKEILRAFVRAHRRGINIEFVVDPAFERDRYSKVAHLANEGIKIWVYQSSSEERASSLMHNKFVIFGDNVEHHGLVWTGSFNFTVRAHERNQENVVILDDKHIVDRFKTHFELLKERSILITKNTH